MKKLFGFVTTKYGNDVGGCVMCEDGTALGSHLSSSEGFLQGDLQHEGRHEAFDKHCPDGWEFEYVPLKNYKDHKGLAAALALNKIQGEENESKKDQVG